MTGAERDQKSSYHGVDEARDVDTVVAGSNAKVKKGPGDQINASEVHIWKVEGHEERQRPFRLTNSSAHRRYLCDRFVEPPRFEQAERELKAAGTVFISGATGIGRSTAAKMLLWRRFPETDTGIRALTLDAGDDSRRFDPDSVQPQETLLLDLSGVDDEEQIGIVRRRLDTFRASVERNDAALVVVLPAEPSHPLSKEFVHPRVELGRPSTEAVLRKHLVAHRVPCGDQEIVALGRSWTTAPMQALEDLAARIAEAKRQHPDAGFRAWVEEGTADHHEEIAEQVKSAELRQRAMLLASSMLKGAHAESAYAARNKLLDVLEVPEDQRHALEREGLDEVLSSVDVTLTASRRIDFRLPNYDKAMRHYFWTNFPDLRPSLRDWVEKCAYLDALTEFDKIGLVTRFAEQACNTGRVADLWELADRWTRASGESRHVETWIRCAARVLADGLEIDSHSGSNARELRRKIYQWVTDPGLRITLGQLLVRVCADVMAVGYPDQALVRLRWLAAHPSVDVANPAREAIGNLTTDNRFYRRFLWRMTNWLERPRPSDIELFLAVSTADRLLERKTSVLIANQSVRNQLTACWRAVFASDDDSIWTAHVVRWFEAAGSAPDGERLLDVLAAATEGQFSRISRLYVLARDWACRAETPDQRTSRETIRQKLMDRLDRA